MTEQQNATWQTDIDGITIRALGADEHVPLRACEDVQRQTWKMRDLDIMPLHSLVAFLLHGGIVLAAFDGNQVVGFCFGYPAALNPDDHRHGLPGMPVFHASQMLGVIPGYQGRGIGYALKLAQRDAVLAQGYNLAAWTVDPLLSRNAYFNITRLGALSRRYIVNLYDELPGINEGLPTDRLEVEWWLASQRVDRRLARPVSLSMRAWQTAGHPLANPSRAQGPFRAPPDAFTLPAAPHILIEIPGDFDTIKAADMGLARAWRLHIRAALRAAFDAGYTIMWLATGVEDGTRRSAYVLAKDVNIAALAAGTDNDA